MLHPSIDTLDDDSLLNIFYLYRPVPSVSDEDEDEDRTKEGSTLRGGDWTRERWWYGLVHVCRRWRYLILASSSFLGVCLVCTRGVPVATMLAHAPSVPLIIDHLDEYYDTTTEEEEDLLLALRHRDRVRRIRLIIPIVTLRKLIEAIDREFPVLEYLYVGSPSYTVPHPVHDMSLAISETLLAPRLRHLILIDFVLPIGSPLMASSTGLVTLSLPVIHTHHDSCLNDFLERISHMPQLETLLLNFESSVPNSDVEGQLSHMPIASHVVLPNLRWFGFKGASAYLEALLPRLTIPLLEKLRLRFFDEPTFSLPHLLQFIGKSNGLKCGSATLFFLKWGVLLRVYPHEEAKTYAFQMSLSSTFLSLQISSASKICSALRVAFSSVEDLTLEFRRSVTLFELTNGTDRAQCRELLRSFSNVKTLRVPSDLVGKVARSLRPEGEESPIELLPELKELACPLDQTVCVAFAPFINARQSAGRPVTLACIRDTIY